MANEKRLIDANALIAELDKFENPVPNKSGYDFLCGVATVITVIEESPTINAVEVVHGRWEDVKETSLYVPDMKYTVTHTAETCSACKVRIGFIGSKQYLYDNICPNCGADMRERKEEE